MSRELQSRLEQDFFNPNLSYVPNSNLNFLFDILSSTQTMTKIIIFNT